MGGSCIIDEFKTGTLRLGFSSVGIFDKRYDRGIRECDSRVRFHGKASLGQLEGSFVGNAAQLCRALDRDVVAHEPDERDPGGGRLAASLEDGAGEGGEPSAAAAAAPPRDAGRSGLGERADTDLVAAAPLADGFSEQQELVGGQAHHDRPKGVRSSLWICPIRPNAHPEGLSPNKDPGGRSGKFSVWLGREWHSGTLRPPNHQLLSKLLSHKSTNRNRIASS